jgi:hypothetical protein
MNAVEIEQAITEFAARAFDRDEFPYQFLAAFGNKDATIKRLRAGATNRSDIGGILQTNNIHIAVAPPGEVAKALASLKSSPATGRARAKFVLATDGDAFEAEDLGSGEVLNCAYVAFPDHFGFFLPLAGITTVKQIRDSSFDIRATSRLNRLYIELLRNNADWGTSGRRHDMNHFMARLIFCFFAENTNIFSGDHLFSSTIGDMSARDSSDTHEVIGELFRAMNIRPLDRACSGLPRWADSFPYVNGGLFAGSPSVPTFSKLARSYLLSVGNLPWKEINPDIFGSMIQAVADDEERGALGMHYTSVPNILRVLDPLFLDDLRARLDEAGENARKLLNLRSRMARIRLFDPACGSGNFLVIGYKEMRKIEAAINRRRGEEGRESDIPLTNFRGIELRDFSAEIARLALIIAEFQCDATHRGEQLALAEFLPLDSGNWITCGNALRLDWLSVCPPTGTGVKVHADDLFSTPLNQTQIDFENEGGETYICGNPPYKGSKWQTGAQKLDIQACCDGRIANWKLLDYVAGWFVKAADYGTRTHSAAAFVATNSICQGQQVPVLWPAIFAMGQEIEFAHTSFKWANLASHNAGVTVVIVGVSNHAGKIRRLFSEDDNGVVVARDVSNINAYLVAGKNAFVEQARLPLSGLPTMLFGNMPRDGGHFVVDWDERDVLLQRHRELSRFIRPYLGSEEVIQGKVRWCVWIDEADLDVAKSHPHLIQVMQKVRRFRLGSPAPSTRDFASRPYRFVQIAGVANSYSIVIPTVSSERRAFLPVGLQSAEVIVSNLAFALYDAPLWNLSLIASRLHLVWIATVCGKLETRYRYSNTLGWNTFPVPTLTEKMKTDLTRCAEDILLAREVHFPASIADLYEPEAMPRDLREAHERNDEVLERIYVGRGFRNDTERLEKLFDLYVEMVVPCGTSKKQAAKVSV